VAFETVRDYPLHCLLRAIDCNTTLSRLSAEECFPRDAYLCSWDDIRSRYAVFEDALKGTVAFGERVRSREQFGATIFPQADAEKDTAALLRYKVCEGAKRRYPVPTDTVLERIEHELDVIERKGFSSYFLIVEDIVRQSPRTCGRGSAAASIVSYCLGITNVDPIRHNLMFERFLNPGRIDPPDIDVDFA
jgi:DNA polymerase III alpha subunit